MKRKKSSFTSFLVIFTIAILAFVAYSLGNKKDEQERVHPSVNLTSEPEVVEKESEDPSTKDTIPPSISSSLEQFPTSMKEATEGEQSTVSGGFAGETEGLPPEMLDQLDANPELPDDLRQQLNAPPAELPEDLQRQLNAPPPPIPDDIRKALETPPRIVTEDEVNDPNWVPGQ